MVYKLYKMTFQSAHFGEGSLEESSLHFSASRLFSALVLESIKLGKYDEFIQLAESDDFVLTDAFPYQFTPFLPKPIGYPLREKLDASRSVLELRQEAKRNKKLSFIELEAYSDYLQGESLEDFYYGRHVYMTKNNPTVDGGLYQVGVMIYESDTSLYVIAYQDALLDELLTSLQFSGLGGKRSAGYGRFVLEIEDLPQELEERLTRQDKGPVVLLTSALPIDEDLEQAMAGGNYLLKRCTGFAFSQSAKGNYRKQDIYTFKAGSTFAATFRGAIYDVRPVDFPHPVHHFAKPLFYRLEEVC
ncbi:TPA: type III-A CRISPR-associated RAMP protein Csm4 [Streptococcus suis]